MCCVVCSGVLCILYVCVGVYSIILCWILQVIAFPVFFCCLCCGVGISARFLCVYCCVLSSLLVSIKIMASGKNVAECFVAEYSDDVSLRRFNGRIWLRLDGPLFISLRAYISCLTKINNPRKRFSG